MPPSRGSSSTQGSPSHRLRAGTIPALVIKMPVPILPADPTHLAATPATVWSTASKGTLEESPPQECLFTCHHGDRHSGRLRGRWAHWADWAQPSAFLTDPTSDGRL